MAKRSPAPEPDAEGVNVPLAIKLKLIDFFVQHTLDLSMTANMDTLRYKSAFKTI